MSKTVWIINQYASTPENGYAGRHYYLGKELARLGYKVYLITSAAHHLLRRKPVVTSAFTFDEREGFTVVWVRMPEYSEAHSKIRAFSWFLFPWRIRALRRLIKDVPDAVVCSSPSLIAYLGAQWLAKKFHARLIFEERDIWPMTLTEIGSYSSGHPFIRFMQWVEDRAYRDSDHVISNLKNVYEHMEQRGVSKGKFTWVPNGFSLEEASERAPLGSECAARLPQGKFIVGYTGTMGVANALGTLIEAAEYLRSISDIAFVLVGGGKEKERLYREVEARQLTNVHFIDPIPKLEVYSMMEHFDVCFIGWLDDPLYRFGIGANKIPEYLYSGKPILHAYSGASDPVAQAQAGLSVPAEDARAIADAVLELYHMSPDQREKFGNNGRNVALEEYEYRQLALEFRDVIFREAD